jgi:hypothetical protein
MQIKKKYADGLTDGVGLYISFVRFRIAAKHIQKW